MIRGLDTVQRNIDIIQKKQENLSTDAANIQTPGYKFQQLIQSTLEEKDLVNHIGGPKLNQKNQIGPFTFGNQIDEVYRNFTPGVIETTHSETDLAITGNAFFTVRTPAGETLYTRNGHFTVNQQHQLVTQEGYSVLAANGEPIQVYADHFSINNDGTVSGTGQRLRLTSFAEPANLTSVGDTSFTGTGGFEANNSTITQYTLEQSNVEMADVMVDMIQIAREFESNQKVLHTIDETLQKATNEIGKT